MRCLYSFVSFPVLILLYLEFVSAFSQCYYPDGSIPTDYLWEPCTGSKYSSCCVPSEGDVCQADGLCYYPENGLLYRGTCTDQTWMDPSCNVGTCVSGFETTWQWVDECVDSGSTSTICGSMSDSAHVTPTCSGNAVQNSAYVTTTSKTSAHRYTSPPATDTSRFSVETDTYTTTITANAQTTTITSIFESTKTSTLGKAFETGTQTLTGDAAGAAASTTAADGSADSSAATTEPAKKKTVTVPVGMLAGIGIGLAVAVLIGFGIFFWLRRRKQVFKKSEAIKLDSTNHPPSNGPVGADQVHPYEAPVNEISSLPNKYGYFSPKVDTYEIDDRTAILREKRSNGAMEMHADEAVLRSPAPAYHEAMMPVELDGTSSIRAPRRG
ncbi:hypothetical protein BDZ45DRAFT_722759 [Acephala macrosclerotiorum]|nr:hypothetical protein BDZ45DRAFT_722759 [Acephala macrosclerotiorum]